MNRILATAMATTLIASGAIAQSDNVVDPNLEGDETASRGADAMRSHNIFVTDGYLTDVDGYYYVDMDGNPVTIDATARRVTLEDATLMRVEDDDDFDPSRGYQAFFDEQGYVTDADGYYYVDTMGNPVTLNVTQRRAAVDDGELMDMDEEGNFDPVPSRGDNALRATDTVVD